MNAGSILTAAAEIVEGSRQQTHGAKERSFRAIADFWNAYIGSRKATAPLVGSDVAQMLVLLKIARGLQGDKAERDHYIDQAGYSGIAGELARTEAATPAVTEQAAANCRECDCNGPRCDTCPENGKPLPIVPVDRIAAYKAALTDHGCGFPACECVVECFGKKSTDEKYGVNTCTAVVKEAVLAERNAAIDSLEAANCKIALAMLHQSEDMPSMADVVICCKTCQLDVSEAQARACVASSCSARGKLNWA